MPDFQILHRDCVCASGGFVYDSYFASMDCSVCGDQFGFGVPIVVDEGSLTVHLSCQIERRAPPWPNGPVVFEFEDAEGAP